jgi:hypothetical protein
VRQEQKIRDLCSASNSRAVSKMLDSPLEREHSGKEVHWPCCVVDEKFLPMSVLPNGRLIDN